MKLYLVSYWKLDSRNVEPFLRNDIMRFSFPRTVPEGPWFSELYRVFLPYIYGTIAVLGPRPRDPNWTLLFQSVVLCAWLCYNAHKIWWILNRPTKDNNQDSKEIVLMMQICSTSGLHVYSYLLDEGFPSHQEWKCWSIREACLSVVPLFYVFSDSFFNL